MAGPERPELEVADQEQHPILLTSGLRRMNGW